MVADQLAQNHDHHDAGGKVVEDGREEECHKGNAPQQDTLGVGVHHLSDEIKASILIHKFYYSHRTHQEEECGRG